MAKVRLYCGLIIGNEWYNYAEVNPLVGGVLAVLDGGDKTGAARTLNLIKGSVKSVFTSEEKEHILTDSDYFNIKVVDAWKIIYEQIKIVTKDDYPIIPESFYCNRCSTVGNERYTSVEESWQKLIDDGLIDEFFLEPGDNGIFEVELVDPIVIEPSKTMMGGTFTKIKMTNISIGDMLKIQRNPEASASEAMMTYATWDAMLVEVVGMSEKDLNILKRTPGTFFSKKYFVTKENQDAIIDALDQNALGIVSRSRQVFCKNCGNEVSGGTFDFSNFFLPFLPKKSSRAK